MLLESCKRSILFLLVGIFFSFISLNAQSYGNEWVDTSKVHVKIRVGEEAVFRVGYFALETYFADRQQFINTIPLNQLRMYSMGKEVPIFVKDQNNNNKFDVFDFIEFVGHKLDGSFDTELYKKPGDHRHTLQSMVTDSNFYFLTWRSSGSGLRYTPSNVANTGTAPKSWHMSKTKVLENWYYNDGMPILIGSQFTYLPEYTNGEGFVGRDVLANGTDTNTVAATIQLFTPFPYPINTKESRIETGLTGGSALLANPNALNHKVIFRIGPSTSNVRRIGDTTWANRRAVTIKRNLLGTDIGSPYTYLTFNSTFVNNIPLSIAYHSHSVIEYPRYYNLGDSIRYGYVEDTSSVPVNIEWSNYGNGLASLPVIFDEVNNLRIIGKFDPFTKKMSYTLPPLAQKGQFFIYDESKIIDLFNTDCIGVKMIDYSKLLDVKNQYLMITSSVLNSSPKEEIKEYVNTWSTRYNVSLSLIEDLYNSFSYGIPHPLAVRKFCKYILENSPNNKPQYLLLLGRGYDMRFNRGVENYALVGNYQFNHIPAIGTPVSDNFYTSGLDGAEDEPAIPTGRIPANTSDEIGHYLFKLRGYLNTYSTYDPWQKDVLHLSGGGSASQAFIIKGKLKYLEKYPIGDPFAGRVFSYGKSAGGTVDVNFRTTIQNHISNGVSLVSFLGHGSPTV
ncbi:MAG: hypothetical protein IT244_10830, partial [Bacteroidia bacterium]|nr:hypothetical protein [Bacteroidia bacterium]